jgi:hypothetical protein
LSGCYHDFNQNIGPPEWTLNAEAYGRILSINPFVPDGVVLFEVLHIRQPHVGGQKFRFVCPSFFQKPVNARKHFFGLYFYISPGSAVTPQVLTIPLYTTAKPMIESTFTPDTSFSPRWNQYVEWSFFPSLVPKRSNSITSYAHLKF